LENVTAIAGLGLDSLEAIDEFPSTDSHDRDQAKIATTRKPTVLFRYDAQYFLTAVEIIQCYSGVKT